MQQAQVVPDLVCEHAARRQLRRQALAAVPCCFGHYKTVNDDAIVAGCVQHRVLQLLAAVVAVRAGGVAGAADALAAPGKRAVPVDAGPTAATAAGIAAAVLSRRVDERLDEQVQRGGATHARRNARLHLGVREQGSPVPSVILDVAQAAHAKAEARVERPGAAARAAVAASRACKERVELRDVLRNACLGDAVVRPAAQQGKRA